MIGKWGAEDIERLGKSLGFVQRTYSDLSMAREYSIPLYIGCMVGVKYHVTFEHEMKNFTAWAVMCHLSQRDSFSIVENENEFEIYSKTWSFDLDKHVLQMIETVEKRLKNILGMERIA